MKRFIITMLIVVAPVCAGAQPNSSDTYAEVGVGVSIIPTVSTKTYTLTDGVNVATGRVELNYDTALTAGAEIGLLGVGIPQLRLGIGYDFVQARFSSGDLVGTLNGSPGSLHFTRRDVSSFGITLDNDVHLVSGNIYYDLPNWGAITPYFGVGAGAAIIQHADTQLALTATAGLRASIDDDAYVALRYRFYHISGPTDDFGIQYDAITNHSIMVMFGLTN